MKTKEITKFLKKNKMPLLIALGAIVVLVVLWIVLKKARGIDTQEKDLSEQYTGQNVTSGINWQDLAIRLRAAFGGPNASGTDESEVYSVFGSLRNQADWEYLKRYWTSYCNNLPWWQRLNDTLMNTTNYTSLPALLIYELDNRELQQCREILMNHGITPDF